jgi:D-alanyl-lipoteichoic acid acyltransferase DltB (MBOAT superfamily)
MTLSAWFRAYFFMPASRELLRTPLKAWREGVVLVAQLSTMILIGLWHGAALNFVLWGALARHWTVALQAVVGARGALGCFCAGASAVGALDRRFERAAHVPLRSARLGLLRLARA